MVTMPYMAFTTSNSSVNGSKSQASNGSKSLQQKSFEKFHKELKDALKTKSRDEKDSNLASKKPCHVASEETSSGDSKEVNSSTNEVQNNQVEDDQNKEVAASSALQEETLAESENLDASQMNGLQLLLQLLGIINPQEQLSQEQPNLGDATDPLTVMMNQTGVGSKVVTVQNAEDLIALVASVKGIQLPEDLAKNLVELGKELSSLLKESGSSVKNMGETSDSEETLSLIGAQADVLSSSTISRKSFMTKLEESLQKIVNANPELLKSLVGKETVDDVSSDSQSKLTTLLTEIERKTSLTSQEPLTVGPSVEKANQQVKPLLGNQPVTELDQSKPLNHVKVDQVNQVGTSNELRFNTTQEQNVQAKVLPDPIEQTPRLTQAVFGQIVQKAKLISFPEITEMRIQLKPDYLGKLDLNVKVENGFITAKFNAENPQVKAILEANLNTLRDALAEQGVKVDQLVVNVGSEKNNTDFRGGHSQGSFQQSGQRKNAGVAEDKGFDFAYAEGSTTAGLTDYYGSRVNFTA